MKVSELVAKLAKEFDLTKTSAQQILNTLGEKVSAALLSGESIRIPNFGTFSVYERAPRNGRNPATGEMVTYPARMVVKFNAAEELKSQTNSRFKGKKVDTIVLQNAEVEKRVQQSAAAEPAMNTQEDMLVLGGRSTASVLSKSSTSSDISSKDSVMNNKKTLNFTHKKTVPADHQERTYTVYEKEIVLPPLEDLSSFHTARKHRDVHTFTVTEVKHLLRQQRTWFIAIIAGLIFLAGLVTVLLFKVPALSSRIGNPFQTMTRQAALEVLQEQGSLGVSGQLRTTSQTLTNIQKEQMRQNSRISSMEERIKQQVQSDLAAHPGARKHRSVKIISYIVKRGDSLWDISARYCKDPYSWVGLYNSNGNKIKNPDLIYPGQKIFVPIIHE